MLQNLLGTPHDRNFSWPFWFTLPLYPYNQRRTLCREVIKHTIWCFEQVQGIFYTIAPVRMTVIRLAAGGLLVYAPIAPTNECLGFLQDLVTKYGAVKYIVLPTSSGIEHKVFVGPFARQFPQAEVWVVPDQWSYPIKLPLSWLGFPRKRTQFLPVDSRQSPFAPEFDYAILNIDLGAGSFGELALFHPASRTLLLTDTILSVPEEPPAIVQLYPYPLLFHARESARDRFTDTPAQRQTGWQRIALFANYLRPAALNLVELPQAWRDAQHAPDRSRQAYFGLYPFQWQEHWPQSFAALRSGGRPFVAPVLQTFILRQDPQQVLNWADRVAQWNFQQIISAHFDAPIPTNPRLFRQAFNFLAPSRSESLLPDADLEFLRQLEANLTQRGITSPAKAINQF